MGNDWEHIFMRIHENFELPRSNAKIKLNIKQFSNFKNYQYFTATQERICIVSAVADKLNWLHEEFLNSGCLEYTLLLQTLLCDGDGIVKILQQNEHLWKPYHTMLLHENK